MIAMLTVAPEDPLNADASQLMDELSAELAAITGDSGKSSFDPEDVKVPNALFVVARDGRGAAVGCGAFRPLHAGVAEVKRMFSRHASSGAGSAILAFLEAEAARMGYHALWLETRLVNERAVRFYESRGYKRIPNFGKYVGNTAAVCFEKRLARDPVAAAAGVRSCINEYSNMRSHSMFVILLNYIQPLSEVDRFVGEHRAFLERHYASGHFLLSGRKDPRTDGVILAKAETRAEIEGILLNDPFNRENIAEYEIVEFLPSMAASHLADLRVT